MTVTTLCSVISLLFFCSCKENRKRVEKVAVELIWQVHRTTPSLNIENTGGLSAKALSS